MKRRGLLLLAALVAGCNSLPDTGSPEEAQAWIEALNESCSGRVPEDVLREAVGDDPKALTFARRTASLSLVRTGQPYIPGNRATLLRDGPATHAAQVEAVRSAKDHIHLDVYILRDDDMGHRYAKVLVEKARAGVKVRIMYDGWGTVSVSEGFLNSLREAGIELFEFNKVDPTEDARLWRLNHRNHRKVLIVDGRIAFTGGINVSDEYSGSSPLRQSARRAGREGWRDTQVRIEGPAVTAFQKLFVRVWEESVGPIPDAQRKSLFPTLPEIGTDVVQLLTSPGADLIDVLLPIDATVRAIREEKEPDPKKIYTAYLAAIGQAQSKVWITQAYFAPDDDFVEALEGAAARGVDVRLVMPGMSDVKTSLHLARHYYTGLLEAGIKLYEYEPAVMHAKTAVIDGVWSTVGSSNLDFRSFIHNDEANAVILGRGFAQQMEELFLKDISNSKEIKLAEWSDRGFLQRSKEWGAWLVKYWI